MESRSNPTNQLLLYSQTNQVHITKWEKEEKEEEIKLEMVEEEEEMVEEVGKERQTKLF